VNCGTTDREIAAMRRPQILLSTALAWILILVLGAAEPARAQSPVVEPTQAEFVAYDARSPVVPVDPSTVVGEVESVRPELAPWLSPELHTRVPYAGNSLSTSATPWVGVEDWKLPRACGLAEVTRELSPLALLERDWDKFRFMDTVFEERTESASYARVKPIPLFHVIPPEQTHWGRGLKKLARAKAMRELRRRARRQWQDQFENSPSMNFRSYQRVHAQINSMGKDPREFDDFDVDYSATAFKQDLLALDGRSHDGENDIPLFTWGPLTVLDEGSTKFDLGSIIRSLKDQESLNVGEERRKSLLDSKNYRVRTGVRLRMDPFRAYSKQDVFSTVRSVGVSVEVDWLSGVLRRELVCTEIECRVRPDGDFKGLINFVINSR